MFQNLLTGLRHSGAASAPTASASTCFKTF